MFVKYFSIQQQVSLSQQYILEVSPSDTSGFYKRVKLTQAHVLFLGQEGDVSKAKTFHPILDFLRACKFFLKN